MDSELNLKVIVKPLFTHIEDLVFNGQLIIWMEYFAFVLYDKRNDVVYIGRDRIGVRSLYYGYSQTSIGFYVSSEMKSLHGMCDKILPFPPGNYGKLSGIRTVTQGHLHCQDAWLSAVSAVPDARSSNHCRRAGRKKRAAASVAPIPMTASSPMDCSPG